MITLCFTLSMPGVASWNGHWSGENRFYAKIRKFSGKFAEERTEEILKNSPYYHQWDDGWCARIGIRKVTAKEAAQIRRKSRGFWGYEWMIDNIISHLSTYDEKVEG